jgi:hypothetical protein
MPLSTVKILHSFSPPPQFLVKSTNFTFNYLGFSTFHYHVHEAFAAYTGYQISYSFTAPAALAKIVPKLYDGLPTGRRISLNVNVASMIQSTFITVLALSVVGIDKERSK